MTFPYRLRSVLNTSFYNAIVHLPAVAVIPISHRKQITGREGIIGEQGKVVEPLTPVGVITIKGEYWSAKSVDDIIEAGENVEIVGLEGLTLRVKRKGH
jgi:membrane-bound serine protease (ClpP class)